MSEPTPRPWRLDAYAVLDPGGFDIVGVCSNSHGPSLEDAAHIVKCVNMHDELVAACKAALSEYEPIEIGEFQGVTIKGQMTDAKDAACKDAEYEAAMRIRVLRDQLKPRLDNIEAMGRALLAIKAIVDERPAEATT